MAIGIVILAHQHLHRTRQLARALASRNVRVVVHVDANTDDAAFEWLRKSVSQIAYVEFADRVACDWGAFSLVQAGMGAAEKLLQTWPGVSHVAQISGSCLPIRPIEDLQAFLDKNIGRDFVESTCASQGDWVIDGLSCERFSLYFPFSWRKQRWLFDRAVDVQRALGIQRSIPDGLHPHVGSQWWCLSNVTLKAILNDPRRGEFDRYFKRCWIPDEGYIPTLVRRHSTNLSTTSLTLSRFDDQGKPHMFYDDHGDLLEQSDQFFARKVWQGADGLYGRFLDNRKQRTTRQVADDLGLQTLFESARDRRCNGRKGRLTVGRFPAAAHEIQPATCRDFTVLLGLHHVFTHFDTWLADSSQSVVHGRLYKSNDLQFANDVDLVSGAIPNNPKIRDTNPEQFLCNLLWNGRDRHQSMMLEHSDLERIQLFVANDPNARIIMMPGSWILDLLTRPQMDPKSLRALARRLQLRERLFERELKKAHRRDVVKIPFAQFIVSPEQTLAAVTGTLDQPEPLATLPEFRRLSRLRFLIAQLEALGVSTATLGDLPQTLPGEAVRQGDDAMFATG